MSQASSTLRSSIPIGDKIYFASPLNDIGFEALDEFVRNEYMENAARLINQIKNKELQIELFDRALKLSLGLSFTSEEGARLFSQPKGMVRLAYELIRPNHPEESFKTFCENTFDPDTINRVNEKLDKFQGVEKRRNGSKKKRRKKVI